MKLLSANAGDSRVVLIRNGKATGLTEDHVPDMYASCHCGNTMLVQYLRDLIELSKKFSLLSCLMHIVQHSLFRGVDEKLMRAYHETIQFQKWVHCVYREAERERIESENPNPKLPLVRYVAGTWRVGGILALSRAFGDAYLKGSLQFEGIDSGTGYSSGFGVIADPYISITSLEGDCWS